MNMLGPFTVLVAALLVAACSTPQPATNRPPYAEGQHYLTTETLGLIERDQRWILIPLSTPPDKTIRVLPAGTRLVITRVETHNTWTRGMDGWAIARIVGRKGVEISLEQADIRASLKRVSDQY